MPAQDPNTRAHLEWLGFIQPNGLVVSAPALVKAGAILNRQDAEGQGLLAGCVDQRAVVPGRDPEPCVRDFRDSRARSSAGASRPRATRARKKLPSRPISRSFSRTTVRRCTRTSRSVSATLGMAHRRGNCSCRCLMPHKTSTRRPAAPADWRRLPRAARSASCAAPGSPPVCCSTASRSA